MINILIPFFLILDQWTKYYAGHNFKNAPVAINGWFKLDYVENTGAAFGMMAGRQTFFVVLTVFVTLFLAIFLFKNYKMLNTLEKWAAMFLISGAVGNLIDRILNGHVVDFISVRLFNVYDFPVFNFADVYVSLAVIIFIISLLVYERH